MEKRLTCAQTTSPQWGALDGVRVSDQNKTPQDNEACTRVGVLVDVGTGMPGAGA